MKQIIYLLVVLFLLLKTESFGLAGFQLETGSVNPVINGKTKLYVFIPGKDSVLFSVTNVSVSDWKIKKAPSHGSVELIGADSRQVWVKYKLTSGTYGLDTLTVEATAVGGLAAVRNVYITSYDNFYQYQGEVLLDKIRLEFYNGQSGLYAESIQANGTFIQGTSYLWPASHLLRAFKNANRLNPVKYGNVLKSYTNSIDRYKSTAYNKVGYAPFPGEARRYYDDNGLLIIQFAEIYKDLNDNKILGQTKIAYLFNHTDRDANWGLPQHETQLGQGMFYSMAVNQTGLGAALLHELTGAASYLDDAKFYYTQLMNPLVKLRDSYYHLFHQYTFYQNGQWSYSGILDGKPVNGQGFRAYQTTHVVQLALKLYQTTGESQYLTDARVMINSCINYWYSENQGFNENSFWGGDDMIDALIDFYEVTAEKPYFNIARDIVDFMIEYGKDTRGYYPGDYDDNFGKWNLDRRDDTPSSYLMMGQAAAASAILRVAKVQSTLTTVDYTKIPSSNLDKSEIFPTVFSPGDPITVRFNKIIDQDIQIRIYSMDGRLVISKEIPVQGNTAIFTMPSTGASNGILIIKVSDGQNVATCLAVLADSR
ncbi:MAG: T9SS type A sorting domain-containing protein [Bacteroidales bacterium]